MIDMGETEHRPYELPTRPWIMRQVWKNFIFGHWPVSADSIRKVVPPHLEIDTYEGQAWIGIYNFRTQGLYLRGLPFKSLFMPFYGINLRTYVKYKGKPGVYFIRLYSTDRLALSIARVWYRLNYHPAQIQFTDEGESLSYQGTLLNREGTVSRWHIGFSKDNQVYFPQKGSLDYFLTERYCLFSLDAKGRVYCGEIHHEPWPLQKAEAKVQSNLLEPLPLQLTEEQPIFHYSRGFDVIFWNIQRMN